MGRLCCSALFCLPCWLVLRGVPPPLTPAASLVSSINSVPILTINRPHSLTFSSSEAMAALSPLRSMAVATA